MNRDRFEMLIDSYGGRISRWPEAERASALALLTQSPDLGRLLADAETFDSLLDACLAPEVGPDLILRVKQSALHKPRLAGRIALWWAGAGLVATGAVAGALIVSLAPSPSRYGWDGWIYDQSTAFSVANSIQAAR